MIKQHKEKKENEKEKKKAGKYKDVLLYHNYHLFPNIIVKKIKQIENKWAKKIIIIK